MSEVNLAVPTEIICFNIQYNCKLEVQTLNGRKYCFEFGVIAF